MVQLPVIVGMGGMNAAGRSSCFHSYKRMVYEVLDPKIMERTWYDLAHRMHIDVVHGLTESVIECLKAGTLVRRLDTFDPEHVDIHIKANLTSPATFILRQSKLPTTLPASWQIKSLNEHDVEVTVNADTSLLLPATTKCPVSCGGALPSGFDPTALYQAHHHPKGLSLTVYGASDLLNTLGVPWQAVLKHIRPDEVSVYVGSALSQMDERALMGLIGAPLRGQQINSKMIPLSLVEMPADFINSYIINNVGQTGTRVGACASFLYNLKQGVLDIQTGRAKVVLVGGVEAPLVPPVMEGFYVMGALANDESLKALDQTNTVDHRRACRPFSTNTGFTLGESVQCVMLMQDALALELGVPIYGSVADVFIHADGNKKSIASPGIGNYITFAKAAALAKSILGKQDLQATYVSAHGTGTPQNRTTESYLINLIAKTFGLKAWPVTAIKAYLGHTVSAASGDQLVNALGVWKYGYIPGICTIDHIAEDVTQSHLKILTEHTDAGKQGQAYKAVFINSKGFGGNNATGLILSPHETKSMLSHKYGKRVLKTYEDLHEQVERTITHYDEAAAMGKEIIWYDFGTKLMTEQDIVLTQKMIKLSQFDIPIPLTCENPYKGYL